MNRFTLTLGLTTLLAAAPFAQAGTPRVDQRQATQQHRIEQGVASGTLSAQETLRLEKEQAHIQKMETRAQADGVVTGKERARLEAAQDAASRDIQRKKHNGRR